MKREKKKRLEAAGWRVGSAREFLDLTDAEAAVVELKLTLAKALREERTRKKMTQEQAGQVLGSSQSRVAKMEAGDPSVSIDLLVRALFRMGANTRDLVRHLSVPSKRHAA